MDKNMMNIDDLVRRRLSGGEEQERTGAWLQMRHLLDQKMPPHKPVAGYNWRRMLTATTTVVLLASLTMGGYHAFTTAFRDKHDQDIASATLAANPAMTTGSNATSIVLPLKDNQIATTENTNQQLPHHTGSEAATPVAGTANTHTQANQSVNDIPGHANQSTNPAIRESFEHKPAIQPIQTVAKQQLPPQEPEPAATATGSTITDGEQDGSLQQAQDILPAAQTLASTSTSNKSGHIPATTSQPEQFATQAVSNLMPAATVPTAVGQLPSTSTEAPVWIKDTIRKMTVTRRLVVNQKTQTGHYVSDTISVEQIITTRLLPEIIEDPVLTAAVTGITSEMAGSKKSIATADNKALVPLSSFKVRGQKTKAWSGTRSSRSFNDVMRDIRFNMAKIRFYPGVIFGVNSHMFAASNLMGVHIGPTGTLTFGDNWSMAAELKYMQRINNGGFLYDNYTAITGETPDPTSGTTNYQIKSVEHFFKFSTLQSIEIPLAIRYSTGRFNFFGGVNLGYHFQINTEEVTRPAEQTSIVTGLHNTGSRQSVTLDDFNARFSLGYVAGIGYQLSPSVQFDFRATQQTWDNATGNGAYKVSRHLYRAPSFQLSIGYRFSQKSRMPRAR